MRDDPTLPWPEYLRAWLDALRYHPDRHRCGGPQPDAASSTPNRRESEPPSRQDRAT
jgi:hypothetical protein